MTGTQSLSTEDTDATVADSSDDSRHYPALIVLGTSTLFLSAAVLAVGTVLIRLLKVNRISLRRMRAGHQPFDPNQDPFQGPILTISSSSKDRRGVSSSSSLDLIGSISVGAMKPPKFESKSPKASKDIPLAGVTLKDIGAGVMTMEGMTATSELSEGSSLPSITQVAIPQVVPRSRPSTVSSAPPLEVIDSEMSDATGEHPQHPQRV